jgi:hypothetical protein
MDMIVMKTQIYYILPFLVMGSVFLEFIIWKRAYLLSEKFYLSGALITLVLASICWFVDVMHWVGSPQSLFQMHSLWHCLSSASIVFLYAYYRSEKIL